MRAFDQRHKKAVLWGLLALAAVWCLWYSRPVDIHFLMGNREPGYIGAVVWPQFDFPDLIQENLDFTAGTPEMDELMGRLETLRFHRSPLEPLLRILPSGGRASKVDPEKDYHIYLIAYTADNQVLTQIDFFIDHWRYGPTASLPLYLSRAQDRGRELGNFLWEMVQSADSNS